MKRPWLWATLVLLLVAGATAAVLTGGNDTKRLSADFESTISLYPGAQVKILGVQVGTVTGIQVQGTKVRVDMVYDAEQTLPADVHAVVVPPSIVGDRFVQLTPVYQSGPVAADGVALGMDRTEVPIELDESFRNLDQLASSLGPNGANADGSLSRLISATARNLDGNGARINQTVRDLSTAVGALSDSRTDAAETVSHLSRFTGALAANDEQVRALTVNLAQVSSQLNGQRDDIGDATRNLADALGDLSGLIAENRRSFKTSVDGLTQVTGTLDRHSHELAELIDISPLGLTGLMNSYRPQNWDPANPETSSLHGRTGVMTQRAPMFEDLNVQLGHTISAMCANLPPVDQQRLTPLCTALQQAGGDLGAVITSVLTPAPGAGLGPTSAPPSLSGLLGGGTP